MSGDWWRYAAWWVKTYSGGTVMFTSPLSLMGGFVAIVAGVVETDAELVGLGLILLGYGMFTLFSDLVSHRNKPKPWRKSPQDETTAPWDRR